MFYFSNVATEAASVRFTVPAGQWTEGRVPVPALGPGYRMRVDPPGIGGTATLAAMRFEARSIYPDFDFTTVPDATSWIAQHDIASLTPATNGLVIAISGSDPYMAGPARDYPAGKLLWLRVRLKSDQSGTAQVFYYHSGPTEANSVKFYVAAGDWQEATGADARAGRWLAVALRSARRQRHLHPGPNLVRGARDLSATRLADADPPDHRRQCVPPDQR